MLKVAKAIYGNTDFLTAQAFIFQRTDWPKVSSAPVILTLLISASGEDIFTKVRVAGLDIEEKFYEFEGTVSEKLKNTLQVLKTELQAVESYHILISFWQENLLHLLSTNGSFALLSRDEQIIDLTSQGSNEQLISGFLKPNDKLLLVSARLNLEDTALDLETKPEVISLSWDRKLAEKLIQTTPETLEDELELEFSQLKHPDPIATVLIQNQVEDSLSQEKTPPDNLEISETSHPAVSSEQLQKYLNLLTILKRFNPLFLLKILVVSRRGRLILFALVILLLLGSTSFFLLRNKFNQINPGDTQNSSLTQATPSPQNATQISDWPVFLSLDLIKQDFKTSQMSISLGKVLMLDQDKKTLVVLNLSQKTNQILAGSTQLGQAKFASLNGDDAFSFSMDKGVIKVNLQNQKSTQIIKPDSEWGEISDIFAFGGNVYLLDSTKNQIWKYVAIASGYSDKNSYLKSKADLVGGLKLKIDYSVWVLKPAPEVLKFTAGELDNFSVGGLDVPISDITSFFVPEKEEKVYILDTKNSRIVVLSKTGQFEKQLIGEKFKSASDFVIDEKDNKLYLLESNKIYRVDLK